MKKNIIYSGFADKRELIIDYLLKRHDWDPVFILGPKTMSGWVKENYKSAVFHEWMQLRNAQFDYASIGKPAVPVDAKIIGALSKYESLTLSLLEDTTGWNFSFQERRRYYYDLLKFWNTVIHHLKPDIYVAWTQPHIIIDYVLYQLCKYYDVPILFTNPAPLFNHGENRYHHVNISLEDQSRVFEKLYNSDKTYKLSDEMRQYFDSVRSKKGMRPPYITYFHNNPQKHWNWWSWGQCIKECLRLVKRLLTGRFFQKIELAWKCNKNPFDSVKSKMNYLQFILFKRRIRRDDKKLKRIYSSFVTKPDFSKKYIYYAAAFQPEAGIWSVYKDQFLILEILSAGIPDDWVIYYKEHPGIFLIGNKSSFARDQHYYKRISTYKNVHMIPAETDTFMLIGSAQAVATPAGTVGWEAIVRGKPALTFGYVWYQDCNGIFRIETYQDCIDAIEKIKNGYRPDQSDVERFAAAVEQVSEKNIIHGIFIQDQIKSCSDLKFEMERIAKALHEAYERHYSPKKVENMQSTLSV